MIDHRISAKAFRKMPTLIAMFLEHAAHHALGRRDIKWRASCPQSCLIGQRASPGAGPSARKARWIAVFGVIHHRLSAGFRADDHPFT